MGRIPPPLLALAAVVVLGGLAVALFLAFGPKGTAPKCDAALAAGPYGCLVFQGDDGRSFRVERGPRLSFTGGCRIWQGDVVISKTGYRTSNLVGGRQSCTGTNHDDEMLALFTGDPRVVEHDDATVTVTNGDRSATFREALAQR